MIALAEAGAIIFGFRKVFIMCHRSPLTPKGESALLSRRVRECLVFKGMFGEAQWAKKRKKIKVFLNRCGMQNPFRGLGGELSKRI